MPFNTDSLSDAQTEDIVRAYLKRKGESTYKIEDLITRFFLRVVSCMHVPRGLADGAGTGSQQAYFKFELPSGDEALLEALTEGLRFRKRGQTYTVNSFGKVEWCKSHSIDSFASFSGWEIYQWARLHERGIDASHEAVRFWWKRFGPLVAAVKAPLGTLEDSVHRVLQRECGRRQQL